MDNDGSHKRQEMRTWLKKVSPFRAAFCPTNCSQLNQVERRFGELSRQYIRRGAFFGIEDLQKAIREFPDA
jgi:hypothetical protein